MSALHSNSKLSLHRLRDAGERKDGGKHRAKVHFKLPSAAGVHYADWIKWIFAILIIVIIAGKFMHNRTSKASFEDVKSAVEKTVQKDDTMLEGDNNMVKRLYGLDPGEFEGVMLKYPSTNMNVNEVLLIKLKNLSQQDIARDAIDKRLETQKKNFDGYGTDQYATLERSVIDIRGNYVLFIVAKKTDPSVKAFRDSLR